MTKKIAIFLMSFIFSSMALANIELCLEDATNAQLLKELKIRLNNPNMGVAYALPTVSCFGANMTVLLLNDDGVEAKDTMSTSSSSYCELYAEQITNKLKNKVVNNTIVGSCFGATLNRLLLKANGSVTKLQSLSFTSSSQCEDKATEVNTL